MRCQYEMPHIGRGKGCGFTDSPSIYRRAERLAPTPWNAPAGKTGFGRLQKRVAVRIIAAHIFLIIRENIEHRGRYYASGISRSDRHCLANQSQ